MFTSYTAVVLVALRRLKSYTETKVMTSGKTAKAFHTRDTEEETITPTVSRDSKTADLIEQSR